MIPPSRLSGVNYPKPSKVERIADSIRKKGWDGRPLLVEEGANQNYFAWTGSHRIEAAIATGLPEVPCLVILLAEAQAARDKLPDAIGYDSLRQALTNPRNGGGPGDLGRLNGLRSLGLADAAAALDQEIHSSEW